MSDLINRIRSAEDFACLQTATNEQILEAERKLKLKFADDYKEYLLTFGTATFEARELTGICSSERLNVVSVTEKAREYFDHFPENAYVIEEMLIDHIIIIQHADGSIYSYDSSCFEKHLADNLYEYLFQIE